MRILTPVLCTSGLAAEARVAREAGFQVSVGAGDPERTTALVKDAARDAKCLVSFGVAGGLSPHLKPGHVILSAEVIGDDHHWRPNERFQQQIRGLGGRIGALEGAVLGSRAILATEDDKTRAWRETGAVAVDLESAIVARAAEAAGIPFLVLRTIADHGRFQRVVHRIDNRGRLITAVHHALGAFLVIAGAVGIPVRLFHQLLEALRIALTEEVAGTLPAEIVARRVAPRRAVIGLIAGQEIEK